MNYDNIDDERKILNVDQRINLYKKKITDTKNNILEYLKLIENYKIKIDSWKANNIILNYIEANQQIKMYEEHLEYLLKQESFQNKKLLFLEEHKNEKYGREYCDYIIPLGREDFDKDEINFLKNMIDFIYSDEF